MGSLSPERIWEKPAAVINGEKISRTDLKSRLKIFRGILERQYGYDVFAGDRGRALLVNLENKALDGMLEERLVTQEARKLRVQINEEQVRQKMEQVSQEIFGTMENLQARLQEDGMSPEDLQNNIRFFLLLEALKRAKAQEGDNPEGSFDAWLIQARQSAEVAIYNSGNPSGSSSPLAGGCCGPAGSSGGCSGVPGAARQADPRIEREAQKAALEAFQGTNPTEKGVTAKVSDYGCHIQVDIQKDGKTVKSYVYQGGKISENS